MTVEEFRKRENERGRKLYHKNIERSREDRRLRVIKWRLNNPEKVKENNKVSNLKRKNNLQQKTASELRRRLLLAVKNKQKTGSAIRDLGCSISEFITYIESKFSDGMTWGNHSHKGWHFDHIKPLALFNLENRDELLKACHYTNIQPMWAEINCSKGKKYE